MVEKVSDTNYCVTLDKTTRNGILNFTKEISIWLCPVERKDKCYFLSASALTPGGWFSYGIDELIEFDRDFPGIIDEAKEELLNHLKKEKSKEDKNG